MLLCSPAVSACCAVLCCAWACSVCCCLRVPLCCRDTRNFLISTRYRTIAVLFYFFPPNIYLGGDVCFQRSASGPSFYLKGGGGKSKSNLLKEKTREDQHVFWLFQDNFMSARLSRLRPPTMPCADKEETISSVTINGLASPDEVLSPLNSFVPQSGHSLL